MPVSQVKQYELGFVLCFLEIIIAGMEFVFEIINPEAATRGIL